MAKISNLWLRNASQRLAGAVLYRLKTQTIARELAAHVTNVRSTAQMMQRTRMANLVNFWKMISFWAKRGAFENKAATLSDYNAFVKANMSDIPVYLTKQMAESGACVIAPYVVTKGSLNPITTYADANENFVSNISLGPEPPAEDQMTLGQMAQLIIANNNGIQNGDQLSYIQVVQSTNSGIPHIIVRAYEYTLNIADTTIFHESDLSDWLSLLELDNGGDFVLRFEMQNTMEAGTFILSRKVGGKLKVSPATLVLNAQAAVYYSQFSDANSMSVAIASYGEAGTEFLAPGESGGISSNIDIVASLLSVTVANSVKTDGFTTFNASANASVSYLFSGALPVGTEVIMAHIKNSSGETRITDLAVNGATVTGTLSEAVENVTEINITLNNNRTYKLVKASGGGNADPGDVTP